MVECIFCKIVNGEIPAKFVYQDEEIAVFPSFDPKAKTHLLVIPKAHIEDFVDANDEILVKIKNKISDLVKELNLKELGYRVVTNGGAAKMVPHLHFHLLGNVSVEREV